MAIIVPGVAVNYPNALLAVGLHASVVPGGQSPVNGPQCIPAEIDWGSMGGTSKVVGFNIGNAGGTRAFTDLCALHVDNSECGADIRFIFTDTQETYTIPAYTNYALVPVFTKALQFYVVSQIDGEIVEAADTTRFSMFNFVPPPVVIDPSKEQESASFAAIDATTVANTQLVPAGVSGTIQNINVFNQFFGGTGNYGQWIIQDGDGRTFFGGRGSSAGVNMNSNTMALDLNEIDVRFNNGLKFVIQIASGLPANSSYSVNLLYRVP